MKRFFVFSLLLAVGWVVTPAQDLTSGTLEGTIVSTDGSPIEGVIVTASGPQGIRSDVTNKQGKYVIRGLSPSAYTVKAEAPGYGTVVQNDVAINIGSRTQLAFTLTSGLTEQVTVSSTAPVVDMKSTTTGSNIRIDDLAPYVPLGRNLTAVFTIAPGVTDGGDPVLGSTNSSVSGSSGLENAYFVDGVNITNSGYGALGSYSIVYGSLGTGVTYDFLEEVQVKTGGFSAEFGQAGGGVINSVVRSGSNTFQFNGAWYETPGALDGSYGQRQQVAGRANVDERLRRDITLSAGGPIVEDKLFFFAAYNPVWLEDDFVLTSGDGTRPYTINDTNGDGVVNASDTPSFFSAGTQVVGDTVPTSVTRDRQIDNYAGKISWYAHPNHKVELTAFGDPSSGDVGAQNPNLFLRVLADPINNVDAMGNFAPQNASTGLDWGGDQIALKYQGVWTSNFFTELQISHKENEFIESGPGTTTALTSLASDSSTFGGTGFYEQLTDQSDQYKLKNTHVFGPVELSYGFEIEEIEWAQPRLRSGDTFTSFYPLLDDTNTFAAGCTDPTDVSATNTACYQALQSSTGARIRFNETAIDPADWDYQVLRTLYTPTGQATTAEERNAFVQATWSVTPSVTANIGLRWTEQELTGSGSTTLPIGTLDNGEVVGGLSTTLNAQSYKFDSEIAPRVGVTWDMMNDGKHKLYVNYGEYFQRVPSDLAVRAFSNEVGTTDERFDDLALTMPNLNADCFLSGGGTSPCHNPASVQGLGGGGSIILDGTQLTPGSVPNGFLGPDVALVGGGKTELPSTEEYLIGYAFELNDYSNVEFRYIHREIGTVLEDLQFASNEQDNNSNFGESGGNPGVVGDPFPGHGTGNFGSYVFANPGGNVNMTLFPTPVRDYDAYEFVFNRRFHNGWMAYANYRYATLEGNYEGSFRNDNGQSDPFLTSLFDFPAASWVDTNTNGIADAGEFVNSDTLDGHYLSGTLNTNRKHILNGFLSKTLDMGLNIGGRINIQSGQPKPTLFAHPNYQNAGEIPGSNPLYWFSVDFDSDGDTVADGTGFVTGQQPTADPTTIDDMDFDGDGVADAILDVGDGPILHSYDAVSRDFFGETPTIVTFDIHGSYDLDLQGGKSKITFLLDIFNVFDDNGATSFDNDFESSPGVVNPNFNKGRTYQTPQRWRLGVRYTF